MEKIWYIKNNAHEEGPFSILDLRSHPGVTPDTLVWKEGFADWIPIRQVKELNTVFEDAQEGPTPPAQEPNSKLGAFIKPDDEIILDMQRFPPSLFFWIIVLVVVLLTYLVYWLNEM